MNTDTSCQIGSVTHRSAVEEKSSDGSVFETVGVSGRTCRLVCEHERSALVFISGGHYLSVAN